MALFQLGQCVATPAALALCTSLGIGPITLIARHSSGDFGDLDKEDVEANVQAIQHDLRIFSSYKFGDDKIYVITESDRSSTCVLLAYEY